jgi:hypothetical protein
MATLGTFTAGQVLTAAELNAIGTWTTYTPTVANLTLGTGGSVTGRYAVINKIAFLELVFTLGTGASASGQIQLGTPSGVAPSTLNFFGRGLSRPTGAGTFYWHTLRTTFGAGGQVILYTDLTSTASTSLGSTSATVPATWASGGTFAGSIVYEVG